MKIVKLPSKSYIVSGVSNDRHWAVEAKTFIRAFALGFMKMKELNNFPEKKVMQCGVMISRKRQVNIL